MKIKNLLSAGACSAAFLLTSQAALALQVEVTVTSNAPTGGVYLTPLWVGFHDGSFDSYNGGGNTCLRKRCIPDTYKIGVDETVFTPLTRLWIRLRSGNTEAH